MTTLLSKLMGVSWVYYFVIALVVALISLGYFYKNSLENAGKLEERINNLVSSLESAKSEVALSRASCEISDNVTFTFELNKQEISDKSLSVDKGFDKLKENVVTVQHVKNKQENTNDEKSKVLAVLPDDGLLSDNFRRLLNQAYCNTEPEDSICKDAR